MTLYVKVQTCKNKTFLKIQHDNCSQLVQEAHELENQALVIQRFNKFLDTIEDSRGHYWTNPEWVESAGWVSSFTFFKSFSCSASPVLALFSSSAIDFLFPGLSYIKCRTKSKQYMSWIDRINRVYVHNSSYVLVNMDVIEGWLAAVLDFLSFLFLGDVSSEIKPIIRCVNGKTRNVKSFKYFHRETWRKNRKMHWLTFVLLNFHFFLQGDIIYIYI